MLCIYLPGMSVRMKSHNHLPSIGLTSLVVGVILAALLATIGAASAADSTHPQREDSNIVSIDDPMGPSGRVRDSIEANGRLFVAGDFTSIGGVNQAHVAEIDPTTGVLVRSFDLEVSGGAVYALATSPDGNILYLGGRFKMVDGFPRTRLAAIDLRDGSVLPWNPGANQRVNALATDGSTMVIGGDFSEIAGEHADRLAAVDAETGERLMGSLSADEEVFDLEWNGHDLVYVAGKFTDLGGTGQPFMGSIDLAVGGISDWRPTTPFLIWDVALDPSGEWVYVAEGGSLSLGGNRLSKFHSVADGRPAWTRQADGDYQAVATDGRWVYAGGHFDYEGKGIEIDPDSNERRKILSVEASDGELTSWNPHLTSVLGVWHLRVTSGGLIVGGDFDRVNWFPQGHLARFVGPLPAPLAAPPAIKPPALPDAECTTQFHGVYRTVTVVSFQQPDEFVIRHNGSWLASPAIDDLVFTEFDQFGGGYTTQWSVPHEHPLEGSFLTRMSVDGGPRLELVCTEGTPLVEVAPIVPPAAPTPPPAPTPGDATCTVDGNILRFDTPDDERTIVRRNDSWAFTADEGVATWTDPIGADDDTYLIRFRENGVTRELACVRVDVLPPQPPAPTPVCLLGTDANGRVVVTVKLDDIPRSLVLRRNGTWLATLDEQATTVWTDVNHDGSYMARVRMPGGISLELDCGTI